MDYVFLQIYLIDFVQEFGISKKFNNNADTTFCECKFKNTFVLHYFLGLYWTVKADINFYVAFYLNVYF